MRRATTFPKFPELPAELQLIIWEFAIPDPRVITYTSRDWSSYYKWKYRHNSIYSLTQTLPGIFHACYNSRVEALKRYKLSFAVELCKPIYFDFARDTLEFGDFGALEAFSKRSTSWTGSSMEADDILTLAITLDHSLHPHNFTLICSNFARLEELKVRERDDSFNRRETGMEDIPPLKVFESEEIAGHTPLGGLLARIRWNIEARGGDLHRGWKPPRVVVGTERQWEFALQANASDYDEVEVMDLDEDSDEKRDV